LAAQDQRRRTGKGCEEHEEHKLRGCSEIEPAQSGREQCLTDRGDLGAQTGSRGLLSANGTPVFSVANWAAVTGVITLDTATPITDWIWGPKPSVRET
jgi:hypothetical protein